MRTIITIFDICKNWVRHGDNTPCPSLNRSQNSLVQVAKFFFDEFAVVDNFLYDHLRSLFLNLTTFCLKFYKIVSWRHFHFEIDASNYTSTFYLLLLSLLSIFLSFPLIEKNRWDPAAASFVPSTSWDYTGA